MTKPCSFNLLTHFEILCTQTADTVEDGPHESELSHGNDDITTMTVSAIYLQYTYIKFNGFRLDLKLILICTTLPHSII